MFDSDNPTIRLSAADTAQLKAFAPQAIGALAMMIPPTAAEQDPAAIGEVLETFSKRIMNGKSIKLLVDGECLISIEFDAKV